MAERFTCAAVLQHGRLEMEALLLAASHAACHAAAQHRLVFCEPQPGALWDDDPRAGVETHAMLRELGAEVRPFASRVFGQGYANGNRIEAMAQVLSGRFLFLDTDTLVLSDLDQAMLSFDRPTASLRREDTWPRPMPGGPDRAAIWAGLHDRFGLDPAGGLDPAWPADDWRHYLYFNAGFVLGPDAAAFGATWLTMAQVVRDEGLAVLAGQAIYPWLDQITLPLAVLAHGGGRDTALSERMDGAATCHYRTLPLLYARESDRAVALLEELAGQQRIKRLLRRYLAAERMIYRQDGQRIRAMFAEVAKDAPEAVFRKRLKQEGLWLR